jgi:hypothetical protein
VCGGLLVSAAAWAAPARQAQAPVAPAPLEAPEAETPEVTDDAIVTVVLQLQRVLQETASFGTWRASGSVKNVSTRVHQDLSAMSKRLEGYANRRGYEVVPATAAPRASRPDQATSLGQLWHALKVMDVSEFSPVFLTVLRDFLGEMVAITHGARNAAEDPALRAMLVDMESELTFDHDLVSAMLLKNPVPPARDGIVD